MSHDIGININSDEAYALRFLLKHIDRLDPEVLAELHKDYGYAAECVLGRVSDRLHSHECYGTTWTVRRVEGDDHPGPVPVGDLAKQAALDVLLCSGWDDEPVTELDKRLNVVYQEIMAHLSAHGFREPKTLDQLYKKLDALNDEGLAELEKTPSPLMQKFNELRQEIEREKE